MSMPESFANECIYNAQPARMLLGRALYCNSNAWLNSRPPHTIQELRKELEKERDERAAAAARGDAMQQQAEALSEEKRELEGLRDELSSEVAALSQRAEALAESAEALLSEKYSAQKKVSGLRAFQQRTHASPAKALCAALPAFDDELIEVARHRARALKRRDGCERSVTQCRAWMLLKFVCNHEALHRILFCTVQASCNSQRQSHQFLYTSIAEHCCCRTLIRRTVSRQQHGKQSRRRSCVESLSWH